MDSFQILDLNKHSIKQKQSKFDTINTFVVYNNTF